MENIYLILVIILFVLAISDLIVGVSNDAVNFLNSAIGAKAASFRTIMVIAALGVLVGATFSSGMMEVARKGIFHPGQFYFSEIMYIFLAVMVTDVILLDTFNTFGLPTSTTVSIVFELLGAAVAIALIKIYSSDGAQPLGDYINSGKALAIISGILLSVVVAFTVGAIVQWITRVAFSFNYITRVKYLGSIWGGIAITAITYFILIKGLKGSTYAAYVVDTASDGSPVILKDWVKSNAMLIIGLSFVAWTVILQIANWLFRINILRIIVLVGTFALAMAFAGNDLVNFIGVPLAGYESFNTFLENPGAVPNLLPMSSLAGKVKTPVYFLIFAGLVMVITLWLSKKARSVVKTSLDLSRQSEGEERFGSSQVSRSLVRGSINFSNLLKIVIPKRVRDKIEEQFDQSFVKEQQINSKDAPSFDMIRASVNLVVASILISFATSLKLPLSTTYVTFMVAMGTSLSDRAWGRESAVYRITGVISVIGGWFFTAFSAFTAAFILAFLFFHGGMIAILIMVAIAAYFIIRTHALHKKREGGDTDDDDDDAPVPEDISAENVFDNCVRKVNKTLFIVRDEYGRLLEGLEKEDLKSLKGVLKKINKQSKKTKKYKDNINNVILHLKEDSIETGHYYVQVLDYMREMMHSISFIIKPIHDHIDNTHNGLLPEQLEELKSIFISTDTLISEIINIIRDNKYDELPALIEKQQETLAFIETCKKNQVQRIKGEKDSTRNSLLFLNILTETKNLLLQIINILKAQRDFADYKEEVKNNDTK